MKPPDLDRLRSELSRTLPGFLRIYNESLPTGFPQATLKLLREFKDTHATYFKKDNAWSLDQHRKHVMDWLPGRYRRDETEAS
jgi:hypothetical protein